MEDKAFRIEERKTFIQQAARASLFAPFIAIALGVVGLSLKQIPSEGKLTIAAISLLIVIFGLIGAFIGLFGANKILQVSKRRGANVIIVSLIGLVLNGAYMALVVVTIMDVRDVIAKANVGRTITPPEGFKEFPEGRKGKNTIHAYIKGTPGDEESDIAFIIEDLGGILPRGSSAKDSIRLRPGVTLSKGTWKGYTIDVVRVEENIQGVPFVTFNVPIPTLPTAIRITITGPQEREEEIKGYLQEILEKGIKGESNW